MQRDSQDISLVARPGKTTRGTVEQFLHVHQGTYKHTGTSDPIGTT